MLPQLIQGGMGAGISSWSLARECSSRGLLGVVSGTALDVIIARRLSDGDPGSHIRRAMAAFPVPEIVTRVLKRYFRPSTPTDLTSPDTQAAMQIPDLPINAGHVAERSTHGGCLANGDNGAKQSTACESNKQRYKLLPLPRSRMTREREWLVVLANFVEVFLAREGHDGMVGINYLHKIQFPTLPSLYGAMLAGVDVVLIGAGIPADIPEALNRLSRNEDVSLTLDVLDAGDQRFKTTFSPSSLWAEHPQPRMPILRRPEFLAIVSSSTLARALLKKAPRATDGAGIDGFVVETPIAGGHNAPPRGVQQLSCRGEPIYGDRDVVDLEQMKALGAPFWLAGGYSSREQIRAALAAGAHGVQLGTVFAFCEESGLDPALRRQFLDDLLRDECDVLTDPVASPTGFPFKVTAMDGTLSDHDVYDRRTRLCDLGYLRRAYRKADGTLGYRCPAEPVEDYVRKGGNAEDTIGRKCLCNALMANIGLGQQRPDGYQEPPLLTAGNELECISRFISHDKPSYHAREVIEAILPETVSAHPADCRTDFIDKAASGASV